MEAIFPQIIFLRKPLGGLHGIDDDRCRINDIDSEIEYVEASVAESSEEAKLQKDFNKHAIRWKEQTEGQSSISSIVMHPDYLTIIGYGEQIIPFILRDLQNNGGHWFVALRTLARTNPVKPEDAGNIRKMRNAWIQWGMENGKLK